MESTPDLLCLHAVRLLGGADTAKVAGRFGLDSDQARELLLDFQARGWVSLWEFAGDRSWSVTDLGRAENERQLTGELDACSGREVVTQAHRFRPTERFVRASSHELADTSDTRR